MGQPQRPNPCAVFPGRQHDGGPVGGMVRGPAAVAVVEPAIEPFPEMEDPDGACVTDILLNPPLPDGSTVSNVEFYDSTTPADQEHDAVGLVVTSMSEISVDYRSGGDNTWADLRIDGGEPVTFKIYYNDGEEKTVERTELPAGW